MGQGRHPTPFQAVLVGSSRGHQRWNWCATGEPRCQLAILSYCLCALRLEMTPSAAISRDGPDGSSYWA